jgi:tetratricopeptide (TPR) repeat protein
MNYPGNASLSSAVKERVVSTFRQTLALYHQRRTDEVVAGCTLILQMDPMFDPARKLIEKARNPSFNIDVDSLLPQESARAAGSPTMEQARQAMVARDFERVAQLTSAILSEDLLNDDARVLGDEAREKLEAGPFVAQFTRRSEQSIAAGNIAAAKMDLEKARALDPTHPEVIRIARTLTARDAAPTPAAAPPSFVIDEPQSAAIGRSTAQAADFGFAFEEEKAEDVPFADFSFDPPATPPSATATPEGEAFSGGFSFDSPATNAAAPEAFPTGDEFDFATASVTTSSDDQSKIRQYLSDGDRAMASGRYQQAIDLWSRIFLIDVTNDDASDRIERAKAKRRQIEQSVEPLLTSGVAAFERGDTAQAHTDLNEVLRLDPQNRTAQEYLDRLGETVADSASARSNPYIPPTVREDDGLDMGILEDESLASGYDAPLIPPPPGSIAATPKTRTTGKVSKPAAASPRAARKLPMTAIAAVMVALAVLGGGWYLWSRFKDKPAVEAGQGQALIARATAMASRGKFDQAIALLQDIEPNDPQHDQALVLIADLRKKMSSAAQMIDGIPADQYYQQRIAAASTAFAAHDYEVAKTAFDGAMRVKPLPPDLKMDYDVATQQVAKLGSAKALFDERKYADAIANLQPLLVQDPQNLAIQRLIIDAHFNNGALALQEEQTADAIREMDEVLKVTPNDEIAKRSRDLAVRYDNEPKDLLYKIYVKYLPLRRAR